MAKRTRWMSVLAVGLVLLPAAAIAGAAATANDAGAVPETRATIRRTVTIPPGAFIVTDDDTSFDNAGDELAVKGPSTHGTFTAPLFVENAPVRIRNMTLYAYDNGAGSVCLSMYRITPANGDSDTEDRMGEVCSTGAANGIREFTVPSWEVRPIQGQHGPYLYLYLPGVYTAGYGFYGAKITYVYDQ